MSSTNYVWTEQSAAFPIIPHENPQMLHSVPLCQVRMEYAVLRSTGMDEWNITWSESTTRTWYYVDSTITKYRTLPRELNFN